MRGAGGGASAKEDSPPADERSAPRRVWCLNLDAEDELRRGVGYTPSRATRAAVAAAREAAMGLLAPGDLLLEAYSAASPGAAGGGPAGEAWCPTPRAQRLLRAAGVVPPSAPTLGALCAANASRFPYDVLGPRLPGASVAQTREQVERWLAALQSPHGAWLKRAFGAAGRGKLRVAGGRLADHARAFLTDDELALGVVLEPHVSILLEVSQHARLHPDGTLDLGAPCVQRVVRGRFAAVRRALPGELRDDELTSLYAAIEALAAALHRAGYFGPLGVDAYRYEGPGGEALFNPCGELNARYTMGYAVGMAAERGRK